MAKSFDEHLNDVLNEMKPLNDATQKAHEGLTELAAPLAALAPELGVAEEATAGLGEAAEGSSKSLGGLKEGITSVAGAIGKSLLQGVTAAADALSGLIDGISSAVASIVNIPNQIAGAVAGLISTFTSAIIGPFQQLGAAIGPFVGALNPSLMQLFTFHLKNLMATIGVGLQPVIQVLAQTMRQLAITIFPAMQALAPIMANLADVLVGNLIPYVGLIADLFVTLAPVLEFVTDLMRVYMETSRVLNTVFRTVIATLLESLAGLFGEVDLKGIAKQFQDVMQTVVKYLVTFSAYLAKFLGSLGIQNNFIDNLIRNFSALQGQGQQAFAAPSGATNKSFEQIGSDMAKAAFVAQGGGAAKQKDQLDFLKELTDSLKDIQQNNKGLRDWLDDLLKDVFHTTLDELLVWLKPYLDALTPPTLEEAKQKTREIINNNPNAAGFALGGVGGDILRQLGF